VDQESEARFKGLPCLPTDSHVVAPAERLDWVRSWLGGVYDFAPRVGEASQPQDFHYRGNWWWHDTVVVAQVAYDAHVSLRGPRQLRADQLDHYRLTLRLEGRVNCDHEGLRQVQHPGDLLISDMSRADTLDYEAGSGIALIVPREMLDEALPRPMDLHGAMLRGAASTLLSSHLRAMASASGQVQVDEAPALALATVNLMAAALQPSSDNLDRARPAVASTLLRQMCRYVDLHLAEPDLSAENLIRFFRISRAALYRLFEPLGGVASYIRERRLARVHALLSEPRRKVYISRLAEDNGFRSATHFSRAFREQYGYSPQELRQGLPAGTSGAVAKPVVASAFDSWLRALRD
jgi:AraC-like DNA-binding protein